MRYFFSLLFLLLVTVLKAQSNADDLLGKWVNEEANAHFEVFKTGITYSAKIIWLASPKNDKGEDRKDKNNPNNALRNQSIVGLTFLTRLSYNPNKKFWESGKVYSPEKGLTADCKIVLLSKNELQLTASKYFITNKKQWKRYE